MKIKTGMIAKKWCPYCFKIKQTLLVGYPTNPITKCGTCGRELN